MTKKYTDNLWQMDMPTLLGMISSRDPGSPDRETMLAVMQAKLLLASEQTARWTKWMAIATAVVAVIGVVGLVVGLAVS